MGLYNALRCKMAQETPPGPLVVKTGTKQEVAFISTTVHRRAKQSLISDSWAYIKALRCKIVGGTPSGPVVAKTGTKQEVAWTAVRCRAKWSLFRTCGSIRKSLCVRWAYGCLCVRKNYQVYSCLLSDKNNVLNIM